MFHNPVQHITNLVIPKSIYTLKQINPLGKTDEISILEMFLLLQAFEGVTEVRMESEQLGTSKVVLRLFSVTTGASVLGSCLLWNERGGNV